MATNLAQASASPQPAIAQDTLALRQVFETIDAHSCPRSFNFHMHTLYSDGRLQPEVLMEQAIAIGLKGLAITDHHTTRGYQAAQHWLKNTGSPSPHLWTGVEITADLLGTEVHILGYAFDPEHPGLQTYLQGKAPQGGDAQAANVIVALHQAGGLAVLAHPARYRRPADELIPVAAHLGIDGVETYYAYNNPNPWQTSPNQTQQVKHLSGTYGLLNTCGTDTHGLNLLQRL
jgi:predicted metal-dependent phosphoesterase TrpH